MDKATIEITKEEAALLPLLYKVPLSTSLEAAAQVMKSRLVVDTLIEKVKVAFAVPPEVIETPAAEWIMGKSKDGIASAEPAAVPPPAKPKRKRH